MPYSNDKTLGVKVVNGISDKRMSAFTFMTQLYVVCCLIVSFIFFIVYFTKNTEYYFMKIPVSFKEQNFFLKRSGIERFHSLVEAGITELH